MEKKIMAMLIGLLFFAAGLLFAAEPVKKESVWKQIASVEKRGFLNFFTSPGEFVRALKLEKKIHPKAWPLTYISRSFTNIAIRAGSSANDILVLPWYVAKSDDTPLTRRFDLPDYAWQKE